MLSLMFCLASLPFLMTETCQGMSVVFAHLLAGSTLGWLICCCAQGTACCTAEGAAAQEPPPCERALAPYMRLLYRLFDYLQLPDCLVLRVCRAPRLSQSFLRLTPPCGWSTSHS